MVCTPLRLRPPLSRFGVYIMGRDYDVDTAMTRKQLRCEDKDAVRGGNGKDR